MANTKVPSELIADNSVGITQLNVSDGTNGQVLTTDGAGTLSFSTISGYTDSDVETYLNTSAIYTDATNDLVGIGTSSPSSFNANRNNLVISDNSGAVGLTINSVDTTGSSIISFTDGASGTLAGEIHYVHDTDYMQFKTANTERIRIDSSGVVDITGGTLRLASGANRNLFYRSVENDVLLEAASGQFYRQDIGNSLHSWFIGNTEQMRIQNDGSGGIHVSIGTTDLQPTNGGIGNTLKIGSDTTKVDSALVLEADNGEFTLYSYNNKFHISETKTSGTFKYLATWDNNGNMATGTVPTTTPLATFHVNMGDNPSGSDEGAVMRAVATNASFGNSNAMLGLNCARSGDSAYRFIQCNSNTTTSVNDAEFVLYGNGNANADGTWNGSGADYAEFFESTDGTAIPRGTSIVIENGKVRAATSEDNVSNIMGVARPKEEGKNSMIIGNTAWNFWTNKYLQDDFGCYIMEEFTTTYWVDEDTVHHEYATDYIPEDVVVPEDAQIRTHEDSGKVLTRRKLNPAWSESDVYVPRLERDEWIIVGLMGQVQILKGQPVNDRWIKMRDISDTVEEWYIR